jgi:hypothetical protein
MVVVHDVRTPLAHCSPVTNRVAAKSFYDYGIVSALAEVIADPDSEAMSHKQVCEPLEVGRYSTRGRRIGAKKENVERQLAVAVTRVGDAGITLGHLITQYGGR